MKLDGIATRSILALTGITLALALPATAQIVDQAAYDRWTPVVVVHYVMVGEYLDRTRVSQSASGVSATAVVKDKVEFTFDWDQSEMKFVGTPVVKNFPTTIDSVAPYAGCGTPRLTGAYEHTTYLTATTTGTGHLNSDVKHDWVAAVVDQMGDEANSCGASSVTIPAKSETEARILLIAPPLYYAMRSNSAKVSEDKKSVIVPTGDGWIWTYTMTPVR